MKKVKIVGAGISGLLCAYYATQKGYQVEVYEAQSECGGKLRTLRGKHGLMETAANAILADFEVESVAQEIGLQLLEKKSEAKRRFIFADQKIQRWPLSLRSTFCLFKFLFLWKVFSKKIEPLKDENLKNWSDRVLNSQITQNLLEPACLGIFGETAQKLSARLIFNYFFSKKKKQLGRLRGSVAPEKGMGQWAECLGRHLQEKGVPFYFSEKNIKMDDQICIIATDLENAGKILTEIKDPRAMTLSQLPNVNLVSVNVFYAQRPVEQKAGFGILFSREQNVVPLGVLFNSDIFPARSENSHSETWIFGSSEAQYVQKHDDFFLQNIQATRQKLWKSNDLPLESRINRWPQAIPLYGLELERALNHLIVSSGSVHLMGNYLGEIGLNRLFHRAKSLIGQL
ncbi:FAD-dependent oxidoreductase [bacterium]|nr:FAD-dependent oxidoreductase [bacterium]